MRRVLVVLALLGVWLPARAEAAAPVCGAHVAADMTLERDLSGCPDGGLTVGDGVTLDLGGHTVAGVGTGDGITLGNGAVLRNGTVASFSTGVRADDGLAVEDVVASGNSYQGFAVWRGSTDFRRVEAFGNASWGLHLMDAYDVEVLDSRFTGNSSGVYAWFAGGLRFEGNTFSGNSGRGLELEESQSHVIGNTASGNGGGGIVIDDQWPAGSSYTIASNVADDNGGLGISFTGVPRIGVTSTVDGGGNRAGGNADPRQCVQVACPGAPAPRLGPLPERIELTPAHRGEWFPVSNLGGGQLEYAAASDRDWLHLELPRVSPRMAPSNVFVWVPDDLSRGQHRANLTIKPVNAGAARHIKVAYTVLAPPALRLSASALPITLPARAVVPRLRTVRLRNAGDGELPWTARTNHAWVTVTPDRGTAPSTMTVRIAPKGLSPGTHTATVRIHPLDHSAPDRTIAVTLHLG